MSQNSLRRLRQRALKIHQRLIEFYGEPVWRTPLPPVDELVSTILSQNTNDTNRDRAFNVLRGKFPSWEAVRDAPTGEVFDAIAQDNRGHYRRSGDCLYPSPLLYS